MVSTARGYGKPVDDPDTLAVILMANCNLLPSLAASVAAPLCVVLQNLHDVQKLPSLPTKTSVRVTTSAGAAAGVA